MTVCCFVSALLGHRRGVIMSAAVLTVMMMIDTCVHCATVQLILLHGRRCRATCLVVVVLRGSSSRGCLSEEK